MSAHDGARPDARWASDARLADGGTVRIRPITSSDRERHRRFITGLSFDTKYSRFMGPRDRLSEAETDRFCTVDNVDRVALVAEIDHDIVAIGRYERVGTDVAEVAFVVADEHQGRGVGTLLLHRLADMANANGITRFTAELFATNNQMIQVFRDAGYPAVMRFEGDGVMHVELEIAPSGTLDHGARVKGLSQVPAPSVTVRP